MLFQHSGKLSIFLEQRQWGLEGVCFLILDRKYTAPLLRFKSSLQNSGVYIFHIYILMKTCILSLKYHVIIFVFIFICFIQDWNLQINILVLWIHRLGSRYCSFWISVVNTFEITSALKRSPFYRSKPWQNLQVISEVTTTYPAAILTLLHFC